MTIANGNGLAPIDCERSTSYWLPRIREPWQRFADNLQQGLAAAIATGKALVEAKAKLPHGEFGRLFKNDTAVADPLPFSPQWARRLMGLAKNGLIAEANGKRAFGLPANIDSICDLAKLPPETLQEAIDAGRVSATMTRSDVKRICNEHRYRASVDQTPPEVVKPQQVQAVSAEDAKPLTPRAQAIQRRSRERAILLAAKLRAEIGGIPRLCKKVDVLLMFHTEEARQDLLRDCRAATRVLHELVETVGATKARR